MFFVMGDKRVYLPIGTHAHLFQVDEPGEGKAGRGLGRVPARTVEDKGVGGLCSGGLLHRQGKSQNTPSARRGEVQKRGPPCSSWTPLSILTIRGVVVGLRTPFIVTSFFW